MDEVEGALVGEEGELVGEAGDANPGVVAVVPGIAEVVEVESQVSVCFRACHGTCHLFATAASQNSTPLFLLSWRKESADGSCFEVSKISCLFPLWLFSLN